MTDCLGPPPCLSPQAQRRPLLVPGQAGPEQGASSLPSACLGMRFEGLHTLDLTLALGQLPWSRGLLAPQGPGAPSCCPTLEQCHIEYFIH